MYSGFFGTVISHLLSLLSTIWAVILIEASGLHGIKLSALRTALYLIAFNSSFAIIRYGSSEFGYKLRKCHIITLNLSTIGAVSIIEAVVHYSSNSSIYLQLFCILNIIPLICNITARDYRLRAKPADAIIGINALITLVTALINENYHATAFFLSYIFAYFFVGDSGFFFDSEVPSIDTYQYLQCVFNGFIVFSFTD